MAGLGVVVGNTHVQWGGWWDGQFRKLGRVRRHQWEQLLRDGVEGITHVVIASVVPSLGATLCQSLREAYPHVLVKECQLGDLPLRGCYPTMGIDRALCAVGAIRYHGCPVLVIDGGTAITITAIAEGNTFWGGAIMPGLRMQLASLAEGTALLPALPLPVNTPLEWWAKDTPSSIYSGVVHGAIAGLEKYINLWRRDFPHTAVVITGGEGDFLGAHLQIPYDPDLIFRGLEVLV
jgi:type III pantothenate kinase